MVYRRYENECASRRGYSSKFCAGASIVDVTDPRWSVYVLYRRISKSSHSAPSDDLLPMGYITVFRFCNPFGRKRRKISASVQSCGSSLSSTNQNETRRICQALIFPPYQRQGGLELGTFRTLMQISRTLQTLGGMCHAKSSRK